MIKSLVDNLYDKTFIQLEIKCCNQLSDAFRYKLREKLTDSLYEFCDDTERDFKNVKIIQQMRSELSIRIMDELFYQIFKLQECYPPW